MLTQSVAVSSGLCPFGLYSSTSGSSIGQLLVGDGDDAALLAVDDGDRAAPVTLAREQPVAEAVVDGELAGVPLAEPGDDLVLGRGRGEAVEVAGVDEDVVGPLVGIRLLHLLAGGKGGGVGVGRGDDPAHVEAVLAGEVEVALVVAGDGHDRARAVLHEHVVGDEDGDLVAVDRVGDCALDADAGLVAGLVAALGGGGAHRLVDVGAHLFLVRGAGDQAVDLGVLGREHEERGAEERVGARREDGEVEVELLAAENGLRALGAADPVALHRDHVLGPGIEQVEVGEQAVGVVGDAEEPLAQAARLDERAAALAAAVDDLLVGEHGGVLGAPVHRCLLAVGEALLEEAEEQPLGPAVVLGCVGCELAAPIDRDAPGLELLAEGGDRALGRDARVLARADRVILGRKAEGVVAHRVDHLHAVTAAEVGDRVADRIVLQMADVGLSRGVREHLEHVGLGAVGVEALLAWVRDLPGALGGPDGLPLALDRMRLIPLLMQFHGPGV